MEEQRLKKEVLIFRKQVQNTEGVGEIFGISAGTNRSVGETTFCSIKRRVSVLKHGRPLPRSFYDRPVLTVAEELLGKHLVRVSSGGNIVARIVEVEAYGGSDDPASHAYRGITERNRVMFGEPGHAYVYFTYGMHFCLNVKAEHTGIPGAVLIRAVEILDGLEIARRNRKTQSSSGLSNGPGKLTKAMDITRAHNGADLVKRSELYISDPKTNERLEISTSGRIGIKNGKDKLWRFFIKDGMSVLHPSSARIR